ncbi:MAG: LLM class F420-dependent oxidoreductase [Steroidobacteraceae bacterium]
MTITIGIQLAPQYGDMKVLRQRWVEAEEMGAEIIWVADHFHAQVVVKDNFDSASHSGVDQSAKNFESTTVQAAMAATTSRARIGCMVHANGYRNPNLLADIARTIDHISGGRYVLGVGSGYLKPDYDEYGYEYGTTASRLRDLARDIPIMKARLQKLTPPPIGPMPMMIASMGDKIGLRIVAEHADMWQIYGSIEKMEQKIQVLRNHCADIGRNPDEIEFATSYMPSMLPDTDLDKYVDLGMRHIYAIAFGPDWDLGELRELVAWKRALG